MPRRQLTVERLLQEPQLGLRLVVEGDLRRSIRGAHTIEIDSAATWMEPGWVMLTTGMRFAGVADASAAQAELVDQLVQLGVPALLFGVGVHFTDVPPGLVQSARAAGLTLIAIAADVPFLQIEQFVHRSVVSADATELQQRLSLQNDLIETLANDQPVAALVQRLGQLIKGTAILYEDSGRVVASTGDGPTLLIWSELRASRITQSRFTVGRWHVLARPTVFRGVGYWIVLASRREVVLDELGEPILDAAERLLRAIRGVRALNAAQSVAEASEIRRMLDGSLTPESARRLWDRLRAFRFEREHPVRAFVTERVGGASVSPDTGSRPASPLDPADDAVQRAHRFGLPLLLDTDPETGELSGVVTDRAIAEEWSRDLAATGFHVGLSEPFADLQLTKARFRDARRALRVARRRAAYREPARPTVLKFEDADMVTWLLSSRGSDAFTAKARQQFGDLLQRADLVETVTAYLLSGMDVKATADNLYLHPNSVRYRLRRVEELIQAPLASAAVVANLYVALHDQLAERSRPDAPTADGGSLPRTTPRAEQTSVTSAAADS